MHLQVFPIIMHGEHWSEDGPVRIATLSHLVRFQSSRERQSLLHANLGLFPIVMHGEQRGRGLGLFNFHLTMLPCLAQGNIEAEAEAARKREEKRLAEEEAARKVGNFSSRSSQGYSQSIICWS